MGSLIAQLTPLAIGVDLSPLPIVAVLVMLITKRARPGSLVLATSWVAGNFIILSIAIAFAGSMPTPKHGTDSLWEGVFALLLGVGLVATGALARRGRRRVAPGSGTPRWVASVDSLSPLGGGIVAFLNATTSPKNLALAITAGRAISQSGAAATELSVAVAYYVILASLSVVIPVAIYFIGGQKSVATLTRWRDVVTANAAAVMEVVLFVLGIAMSAKGLLNLLT